MRTADRSFPQRLLPALMIACAPVLMIACAGSASPLSAAQDLLLENVRVLDPATRTVTEGSLLIREGRVAEVGQVRAPDGVERRDLEGRWVLPGFFDLHTHSFGNASPGEGGQMVGPIGTARLALYVGVVGFLDLFSMEDLILGMRDQQRRNPGMSAGIYASGPCLTATGGHCSEYGVPTRLVDSPEDARREVGELAAKRPDVVKLVYDHQTYRGRTMPTVDRATMEAVVATAHEHDLPVVVHVGTWTDLIEAAEAGADAVTHTPGPEAPPTGLPERLAELGTLHIPTLAVQSELGRIADDPSLLDRPLLGDVVAAPVVEAYRNQDGWSESTRGFVEWVRTLREPNLEAVRTLATAGVRMATGTDGGNFGVFQGYSVHREMELLVEAGLEPWEALRAATTEPAAFLGAGWGVHPGAEASLVILEDSPLEDITNTQAIHAVILRGQLVDRDALR